MGGRSQARTDGGLVQNKLMKRRELLRRATGMAGGILVAPVTLWVHAADQVLTPSQDRGPFYPRRLPVDKDFDLTAVAGNSDVAYGQIVTVSGRVTDLSGTAQPATLIEIWQVNGYGRYHHEGDSSNKPIDPNFQGYGAVLTDQEGRYSFRTVKPIAYPGRAPHIHFALTPKTGPSLVTQMYVDGSPENERDFLLSSIRDKKQRNSLIVAFEPVSGGGERQGQFDIVLPKAG
jgi:protocatechuate 3,4-dioxygenase, beta subunit